MRRTSVLMLLMLTSAVAGGQVSGERSPTRDMLDRARAALNDLRYARADSIAREVLALGARGSREARAEALQLLAAANYPESEGDRRVAQARSAIVELLKLDLGFGIPRDLAWAGLDSLYQDVSRNTYAISVVVRRNNPIVGIGGTAPIRVRANRPSTFVLTAHSRDGIESVLLDSVASATDTTLALRVGRNGRQALASGDYEFDVRATDQRTREAIDRRFEGVALVPPIEYLVVPATLPAGSLKPERSNPRRAATIAAGLLVGAATMVLGKALRAEGAIRDSGETDRRYQTVSAVIISGSIAAALLDRGRLLDRNREANRRTVRDFADRQSAARTENGRRAAEYHASITLNPEPK